MTTETHRVTHENPPPKIWSIPIEIRRRLSGRVGRQRAMACDDHLLMVLQPVPDRTMPRQPGVYFWRCPEGEWSHSEQGAGFAALEQLVQDYENVVVELEREQDAATSTKEWFQILERVGPIHRAARSLHDTLLESLELSKNYEHRTQLQPLSDQASEVERSTELLQSDVRNSIQYEIARQTELQAGFSRVQSRAAHRLNVLVAIFLPLATLSSVFGMNLATGFEGVSPVLFWLVLILGAAVGGFIGINVMNVRGLSPDEW